MPWEFKIPMEVSTKHNYMQALPRKSNFPWKFLPTKQHPRVCFWYYRIPNNSFIGLFSDGLLKMSPIDMKDVIQSPAAMSQAPHPFLTSHPIHLGVAKNEGIISGLQLPASMTPPLMANGHQPFTMQSHINQLSQPHFTSMCPVPIVGPSIMYSAKFP